MFTHLTWRKKRKTRKHPEARKRRHSETFSPKIAQLRIKIIKFRFAVKKFDLLGGAGKVLRAISKALQAAP
jgi:hypothetical protein